MLLLIDGCAAGHQTLAGASEAVRPGGVALAKPTMRYAESANRGNRAAADSRRAARFSSLIPELDRLFTQSVESNQVAGLAVGIVLDGQIVYVKGFGLQNRETHAAFDTRSVFRVASVTKSITAMAVLKLRDEGKLRLDDPAVLYYPPLGQLAYPTRDSAEITVRQLLTHGSGLPEDNNWVDAGGTVTDEQLQQLLQTGMRFSRAPNTSYEYSNTGYALLGKVIEGASGKPAREYIRQEILQPLGMTSSVWNPAETSPERVVLGYRGSDGYHGRDEAQNVASIEPLGVYDMAGGLYASIDDMAKYVAFHLSAWPPRNDPEMGPLSRSSVREMHQGERQADPGSFPRVLLPSRRPAAVRGLDGQPSLFVLSYGFGFFGTTTCDDVFYAHHEGQLPGYTTSLSLYPARGYGIVVFVNDERLKSSPLEEATALLRSARVIDPLEPTPVPALDQASAEVDRLLDAWDDTGAQALFDSRFWRFQTLEKFREQMTELSRAHGRCQRNGTVKVNNLTRGSWQMTCESGEIAFVAALSPEIEPRLQTLLWEDSLPPSPALERLGAAVAPLIAQWDDSNARRILAPSVDMARTRKQLARVGATHGPCNVERALSSDGSTKARFLLACAEGALELSQTIDVRTGQITRLSLAAPRTMANCAP
ncbi:MAG: serine hydrolase domain-containing protein [Deltaproteobacteria bacterium]